MRRREVLAGLAGASLSLSGCSELTGSPSGSDAERVTIETLDAPGSEAGSMTVPAPDGVTFVEFFATTCAICASQMSTLREVYRSLDSDVRFLSVTSEPVGYSVSKDEVVAWWRDHGGEWPVGLDDGTTLARRYDATSVPTAVVIEPDGTVTWSHTGSVEASAMVEAVRAAREGEKA